MFFEREKRRMLRGMEIINAKELRERLEFYPEGEYMLIGEYQPDMMISDLMIVDRDCFGAVNIVPRDGEVFDWDWSIVDYSDEDLIAVFDVAEVIQMIKTLSKAIPTDVIEMITVKGERDGTNH